MAKYLTLLFFIVLNLNAMSKDIIYVEDVNSKEPSLKDEFFNPNTKYYTLTIATLKSDKYDIIEFFKRFNLTNAVAYKYGKNKEYIKIISGLYTNGTLARESIKKLDKQLQKNRPYSSKLFRHNKKFNPIKKEIQKRPISNNRKHLKKIDLRESKNSVFIENTVAAQELKKEFFNKDSKYYSIALGSITLSKTSIEKFFKTYNIGDKALAHKYGKNKDKVRIIYGLYTSKNDAQNAIKGFSKKLRSNSPYPMNMSKFQSFYKKSFPNINNEPIIELKENNKENKEKLIVKPKLSKEIKIIEKKEKKLSPFNLKNSFKKDSLKTKLSNKKIKKEKVKKKPKVKIKKPKVKKKSNVSKKFLKESSYNNIFFVESDGSFNILSEVFMNEDSTFYTVDLGELNLSKVSIEEFMIQNNIKDNALAYKYGDKNKHARVVYGAYETKEEAKESIKKLELRKEKKEIRVSNIKNHQKLYKMYNKDFKKKKIKKVIPVETSSHNPMIFYVDSSNKKNDLLERFLQKGSLGYTITLITFLEEDMDLEQFLFNNNLNKNVVAYKIGTENSYYRVIYGFYDTFSEAKENIRYLAYELRKNGPYISSIKTNQKKFESYENRNLEKEKNNIRKIEFKQE